MGQSIPTASRAGVGRPTPAQAKLRHDELLNHALDIFLEHGFEQTTTEEIAVSVGMSKRTVYARYEDKAALFRAAVQRAIERYAVPLEAIRAAETSDIETTLVAIARIRLANLMEPASIKLQRILNAESYRFPELLDAFFTQAVKPTTEFLRELFVRRHAAGEIDIAEPERAAVAFLSLVLGGPARIIVSGAAIDPEEIEARIRFAVRLFLNGVRRR